MSIQTVRITQPHSHNTFPERGVLVPFTSPSLVGTRARIDRTGMLELLVPNHGGASGFVILPWPSLRSAGRPTVFDVRLCGRLARLNSLAPAAMRRLTRAVAMEGFAGHAMREAAEAAEAQDLRDARATAAWLRHRLQRQAAPRTGAANPIAADFLAQPMDRQQPVIERLAHWFSGLGPQGDGADGGGGDGGSQPRLLAALAELEQEVGRWALRTHEDAAYLARQLLSALHATVACTAPVLAESARRLGNPAELLRLAAAAAIPPIANRPDWLLDGWEHVLVRWHDAASDANRFTLMRDLRPLIPTLPKEAGDWAKLRLESDLSATVDDLGPPDPTAGLSSARLQQIGHNEALNARALRAVAGGGLPRATTAMPTAVPA